MKVYIFFEHQIIVPKAYSHLSGPVSCYMQMVGLQRAPEAIRVQCKQCNVVKTWPCLFCSSYFEGKGIFEMCLFNFSFFFFFLFLDKCVPNI